MEYLGRVRLFEVIQKVNEINFKRKQKAYQHSFTGESCDDTELKSNRNLKLNYIAAPPRMALYMKYSTEIYSIYLKYLSPEDIFAYSIDEVFCDITHYLKTYNMSAQELITKILKEVYKETGITATAGLGTNLYLAKISMDIVAKHVQPNKYGVRIAGLDEMSYRKILWNHRPLKYFWRVGKGYSEKLEKNKIYTMGDIARCSIENEEILYNLFGVNAELLIDHAWGWEPCTIEQIKKYKPSNHSISSGQVLHCAYNFEKTKLIVREMTDLLTLELVEKNLVTDQIVLNIGYDVENLMNSSIAKKYKGEITTDRYGRKVPKDAHGTKNLKERTSSTKLIMEAVIELYEKIVNTDLLVRRLNITANHIVSEECKKTKSYEQLNMFTDYKEIEQRKQQEKIWREKENKLQHVVINIKRKYGKNAILKGMNFEEGRYNNRKKSTNRRS